MVRHAELPGLRRSRPDILRLQPAVSVPVGQPVRPGPAVGAAGCRRGDPARPHGGDQQRGLGPVRLDLRLVRPALPVPDAAPAPGVWAGVLIGVAIAFKLQAVFMLPVLVLVAVHQQVTWKRAVAAVSAVPVTFVVSLLPAWLAGASISQLASIYPAQISGDGTATTGTRGAHGGGPGGGFGSGAGLRGGRGGGGGTVTTDGFGNSGS